MRANLILGAVLLAIAGVCWFVWLRPVVTPVGSLQRTGTQRAQHAGPPWFVEVTEEAGITFRHTNGHTGKHRFQESVGAGVALFDYDGDGRLDIYFVNGNLIEPGSDMRVTNVLFRNLGDGRFRDVTAAAGVGDAGYGQGCCAADFDNDGDTDLYVTNVGPDRLYRNDGAGRFEDVTLRSGISSTAFGQCAAFFDYDGDGWLDLYVQNYVSYDPAKELPRTDYASPNELPGAADVLYRNNGDGTFTDVTRSAGIHRPDGHGMGLVCADLDEDGDLDIFVANDGMENYCFLNNGDGTFVERGLALGLAYDVHGHPEASMGADLGDHDGDGTLDIVCPALRDQGCTLYAKREGVFRDVSHWNGLAAETGGFTGFSPNFLDFDNDGDLDLYVGNGEILNRPGVGAEAGYGDRFGLPDLLMVNDGEGGFETAPEGAVPFFKERRIGRGTAVGDLDNDGDLDVVLNNLDGAAVVLRNDTRQGSYLTLQLETKTGNRDAIGARVRVTAAGRTQVAAVRATGGYVSLNDRRPHFGLGSGVDRVSRIEIVWPDGSRQELRDVAANQLVTVRQSE